MVGGQVKIGLNLLGLPTLQQGGAGMIADLEARELARRPELDVHIVANERVADELADLSLPVTRSVGSSRGRRAVSRMRELAGPLRYMDDIAPAEAFASCEVVHYPLSFMAAPGHDAATVVTCVDLQHRFHPEFFSVRDRILRRIRWDRAAKKATRVAVSSEFVRQSIELRLGIGTDRIDVVGACCNPRFRQPPSGRHPQEGDYLLYPASPLPAKNHGRLLEAFSALRGSHSGLRLVLVGPATHDWAPVRKQIASLGLEGGVEVRGHVSLEELVDLYAGARALVFPSLFEGFGIPVLEAMTVGCPVAAADVASIPEICGEAAILFDPSSVDSILTGLTQVVELPEAARTELLASASARAREFSVEAMVDRQVRSFRRAAGTIRRS
jgi:glycosyltransferase involved in cell wall biosynthesis